MNPIWPPVDVTGYSIIYLCHEYPRTNGVNKDILDNGQFLKGEGGNFAFGTCPRTLISRDGEMCTISQF